MDSGKHDEYPWIFHGTSVFYDMKYKALVRSRRGQCLSPLTAPALAMVPYYLFGSYCILGGATACNGPGWGYLIIRVTAG
jgi:hypothetical protein